MQRPCLIAGASANIGEDRHPLGCERQAACADTLSPIAPPPRVFLDGGSIRWYGVVVRDSSSVTHLVKTIKQEFGAVPALVYCARIVKDGSVSRVSDEACLPGDTNQPERRILLKIAPRYSRHLLSPAPCIISLCMQPAKHLFKRQLPGRGHYVLGFIQKNVSC